MEDAHDAAAIWLIFIIAALFRNKYLDENRAIVALILSYIADNGRDEILEETFNLVI